LCRVPASLRAATSLETQARVVRVTPDLEAALVEHLQGGGANDDEDRHANEGAAIRHQRLALDHALDSSSRLRAAPKTDRTRGGVVTVNLVRGTRRDARCSPATDHINVQGDVGERASAKQLL
jgi:hypothetical protein